MKPFSIRSSRALAPRMALILSLPLWLVLAGCQSDSGSTPGPASGVQKEALSSIERVQASCERSGANWDPLFFSCTCPLSSEIFVYEVGCRPLPLSATAQACLRSETGQAPSATCLAAPFSPPLPLAEALSLATPSLSETALGELATALRSGAFSRLFQGRIFRTANSSRASSGPRILLLKGAAFGSEDYRNGRIADDGKDSPVVLTTFATDAQVGSGTDGDRARCEQAVATTLSPAQAASACRLLSFGLESLQRRELNLPPGLESRGTAWITRGDGCFPSCQYFRQLSTPETQGADEPWELTFAVDFLPEFIPLQRSLTVRSRTFKLRASLTALGAIEGFELEAIQTTPPLPARSELLIQGQAAWDATFREQRVSAQNGLGDFSKLHSQVLALRVNASPSPSLALAAHEDPARVQRGAIQTLMVDSGIDLGAPGLGARFALAPESLDHFPLVPDAESFFAWLAGPVFAGHPSTAIVLRGLIQNAHGTEVASVLTRDLPDARVHWVPSMDLLNFDALKNAIRASAPRVVNFSITVADERPDCMERFDELFAEFPEVLFIAGAGNTRTSNPTTCPARSAAKPTALNALAVAGTQTGLAGSPLDPSTSRGASVAKLAAPFRAPCLHQVDEGVYEASTCAGTSFASPFVGNLALKILVREPHLGPRDVIARIRQHCVEDRGLDVAWHCALPLSATP